MIEPLYDSRIYVGGRPEKRNISLTTVFLTPVRAHSQDRRARQSQLQNTKQDVAPAPTPPPEVTPTPGTPPSARPPVPSSPAPMPPSSPGRAVPPPPAPESSAPRAADLLNRTPERGDDNGNDNCAAADGDAVVAVPQAPSGSAPVPVSVAAKGSATTLDTAVDSLVEGVAALSVTGGKGGDGAAADGAVNSPLEKQAPSSASKKVFGSPGRHKTPAKSELRSCTTVILVYKFELTCTMIL